jgi:hypothetical protein
MTDNKTMSKDQAINYLMDNPNSFVIDQKTNVMWTFQNLTSSTNITLSIEEYNRFPNSMFSILGNKETK